MVLEPGATRCSLWSRYALEEQVPLHLERDPITRMPTTTVLVAFTLHQSARRFNQRHAGSALVLCESCDGAVGDLRLAMHWLQCLSKRLIA